ncbi:MAG: four helix bundle protein [Thermodesulfobacteriota bacterium]
MVYQRAIDFVVAIYQFCKTLPGEERFGLIDQIRRSATSMPINIAEGSSSSSELDEIIAMIKGLMKSLK